MFTYTVTFDRVGRKHDVAPLVVEAADAFDLAERIYGYVRPHLASRDVEVITPDEGTGYINCGFNNGGSFTVSRTPATNDKDS